MSGIEAVGLVLAAFPLIISSLEHYETTRKVANTWWKFRRAHKRDIGRVTDCQLKFHLNLNALLAPLETDGTMSLEESQRLLVAYDKDDVGWQNPQLQEALRERLGPTKERFFAVIGEMDEAITKLAKLTMVTDSNFQEELRWGSWVVNDPVRHQRLVAANQRVSQEFKKISYSVTGFKRDSLLDEIDRYNDTLSVFLRSCDDISQHSVLSEHTSRQKIRRQYRTLLSFWTHANSIFHVMASSWKCQCAAFHCAHLWLGQEARPVTTGLDVSLRYSDETGKRPQGPWDRRSLQVKLCDTDQGYGIISGERKKTVVDFALPKLVIQDFAEVTVAHIPHTQTLVAQPRATSSTAVSKVAGASSTTSAALYQDGLCLLAQRSAAFKDGTCIGELSDHDTQNTYRFFRHCNDLEHCEAFTISEVLSKRSALSLFRTERLVLAYIVASSFLRYHDTPWLAKAQSTIADCTFIPLSHDGKTLLYSQPFVASQLQQEVKKQTDEYAFAALGILLLELCFNKTIEEHPMWEREIRSADMMTNPWARQAVASRWARDVVIEADTDYACAVDWCVNRANLRDPEWRVEFARNVVQPLKKCYDAIPRT